MLIVRDQGFAAAFLASVWILATRVKSACGRGTATSREGLVAIASSPVQSAWAPGRFLQAQVKAHRTS
jgi:hypothetical protein